jgi:hypothetical protein
MRKGKYQVDPYVFVGASSYRLRLSLRKAIASGALEVVIDSRRLAPLPGRKDEVNMVWIEMVMPDGARERVEHAAGPWYFADWAAGLRMRTILDEQQEGDVMTGELRIRLNPEDREEALFPITTVRL